MSKNIRRAAPNCDKHHEQSKDKRAFYNKQGVACTR